jgi:hypothetical protein
MTPAWHWLETVRKENPRCLLDVVLSFAFRVTLAPPCGDSPCELQASLALGFSAMLIGGHRGGGPRANMENLEMTKNTKTSSTNLVDLKLAVIKFHNANVYTETNIARDACFTSHNSLDFKAKQMADVAAEIKDLMPERGSEVADVRIEKLLTRYDSMEMELYDLSIRHEADLEVYRQITGETWSARPRRTHQSSGLGLDERLAKFA